MHLYGQFIFKSGVKAIQQVVLEQLDIHMGKKGTSISLYMQKCIKDESET